MEFFYRHEVLRHNKRDDCWIIVQNSVYNITDFIANHPGGSGILMSRAGEDATSYFITKHGNNKSVLRHLENLKIGELHISDQITTNDFDEPFLIDLIDECYKEKLYQIPVWYKNSFFYIRSINIILFASLTIFALFIQKPWYLTIAAVVLQSILGTSLFGLVAHEATHRNFPKNIIGRFMLRISWPIFWPFISQKPLQYEHNSHHVKIGDPEFDYEVAGFSSVIRYSGHVPHSPIHKKQHKIARYIYPFYANIITTVGGIKSGFWEKHNRNDIGIEHTLSILATMLYFIVIPTLVNGNVWWYILLYLIYQCTLYYGIYLTAAINHFVPLVAKPIPLEHQNKYGYYVCHNTTNFCTPSYFWLWFTGGFNIQIEHHLIPFVPMENLKKMIPIVKNLCEKYQYPYHDYKSFRKMWQDHYTYLSLMSDSEYNRMILDEMANKTGYQGR